MEIENWWASNVIIAGIMKRASPDPENPKAYAAEIFIQANLHLLLCIEYLHGVFLKANTEGENVKNLTYFGVFTMRTTNNDPSVIM